MNCKNFRQILVIICAVFAAWPSIAKQSAKEATKDVPTRITADIIDIKQKSAVMEFINNVIVKKGADHMMADHMFVYYEGDAVAQDPQNPSKNETSIKKIIAKNNVKISSAEFIASGDNGNYDPKENLFILEDNVVVNNGSSIAKGDKFVYNLVTKKGNLIGRQKLETQAKSGAAPNVDPTDKRVVVIINENDIKKQRDQKDAKKSQNKQE